MLGLSKLMLIMFTRNNKLCSLFNWIYLFGIIVLELWR